MKKRQQPSLFSERALAKRHLAVAERHVEESRGRISRQRSEVARLEDSGRRGSLTMWMARELLQTLEHELLAHLTERDQLRRQLRLPRAALRSAERS